MLPELVTGTDLVLIATVDYSTYTRDVEIQSFGTASEQDRIRYLHEHLGDEGWSFLRAVSGERISVAYIISTRLVPRKEWDPQRPWASAGASA